MSYAAITGWGMAVPDQVLTNAELGSALNLSRWVTDISPFSHVPKLPGGAFTAAPLLWLACVAVALTAVGLVALRRRELA